MGQVEKLNVTEEQKGKLKEIADKYRDKLAEARKQIPAEVQKAMAERVKKASSEGKKGKEAEAAVREAVKLTPDSRPPWTNSAS